MTSLISNQVLWGDIPSAVKIHNMLYQATVKNKFLPEVRKLISTLNIILKRE